MNVHFYAEDLITCWIYFPQLSKTIEETNSKLTSSEARITDLETLHNDQSETLEHTMAKVSESQQQILKVWSFLCYSLWQEGSSSTILFVCNYNHK